MAKQRYRPKRGSPRKWKFWEPKQGELVVVTKLSKYWPHPEHELGEVCAYYCPVQCREHRCDQGGAYRENGAWLLLTSKGKNGGSVCWVRSATEADEAAWRLGGSQ